MVLEQSKKCERTASCRLKCANTTETDPKIKAEKEFSCWKSTPECCHNQDVTARAPKLENRQECFKLCRSKCASNDEINGFNSCQKECFFTEKMCAPKNWVKYTYWCLR